MALDLPADARSELADWRRQALGAIDGLCLVDPAALHVTLVFLGHLPESEIDRIAALIDPPAAPAPSLHAAGVRPMPPRRPRLFALDLEDEGGRAGQVQAAIAGALAMTPPLWRLSPCTGGAAAADDATSLAPVDRGGGQFGSLGYSRRR